MGEYSEEIEQLSKEQKDIRIQIENSNNLSKIIKLRKKRNKILKEIQHKQKEVRNKNADNIIEQIDKVQNDGNKQRCHVDPRKIKKVNGTPQKKKKKKKKKK